MSKIKNSYNVIKFKIELDNLKKMMARRKIQDGIFWELSDDSHNRIWSAYRYWLNIRYVLGKDLKKIILRSMRKDNKKRGDAQGGITCKQ